MQSHMRVFRFRFAVTLTALIWWLAATPIVHTCQSPPLGELALKEQERRKALKVTGKVLTDQDLPKTVGMPPAPAAPAGVASRPADPAQAPDPATAEVKDETWWRQRIGQLRDSLRRNEILAEALQTRINALTNDFASRDDPHQRARIADDRQKATAELDRVRSEIELQKRKTGEIEDEARRAGVPPGWLR
jgi:hypothetical protein